MTLLETVAPPRARRPDLARVLEVARFLLVGGLGYVVDVGLFNLLRLHGTASTVGPLTAKVLAVAVAMVLTYVGNRWWTWRADAARDRTASRRVREVTGFVVVNLLGMGTSVVCLALTHDVLGLVTRWEDNLSANVVGLGLGTVLRFWAYRHLVFVADA